MDMEQIVTRLFDSMQTILERVTRVEGKLDAYNGLNQRLNKLEERLGCIEAAPGRRWTTLTTAILVAVGTAVGGGIVLAVTKFIK